MPDDVFDALLLKISAAHPTGFTPEFDSSLNTYLWHGRENANGAALDNGCSFDDVPDLEILWGGVWFSMPARDLVVKDDQSAANPVCRFGLKKGGETWSLG